ncbi:MAG: 50S ribosomal protein L6 [Proteobacteria bacterium]|nr:50S ribosomal protein L6 [Pseudomonadota bacterium]
MSRMGKMPVFFNEKISVNYENRMLKVKGKLGEIEMVIPSSVDLEIKENQIRVMADFETKEGSIIGGTIRSIVNNNLIGISEGFTKTLNLVGVGYRAQVTGQKLILTLGFSHNIDYSLPEKVKAVVEANTKLTLTSCDKQLLGQVAAEIRKYRPPEPYKGKGVLFEGERIVRKAGKTAKSAK